MPNTQYPTPELLVRPSDTIQLRVSPLHEPPPPGSAEHWKPHPLPQSGLPTCPSACRQVRPADSPAEARQAGRGRGSLKYQTSSHGSRIRQSTQRIEPIGAGCCINGASTLWDADLLVRQHVMNTCALQQHLDRCRVQEHFTTKPKSLHTSENQLQRLLTSQEADAGYSQKKKFVGCGFPLGRFAWNARGLAGARKRKAAQSAPKTSQSAPKPRSVRPQSAQVHTPTETPTAPTQWSN